MKTNARHWLRIAAAGVLLTACQGVFDVESPGRIADKDLNTKDAISGIVTGMSYDIARALDNSNEAISLLSSELWHGGSYNWGDLPRGIVNPEDVNGTWEAMFRPRYTTTAGIERIKGLLPANEFGASPVVARAYLLAGFANRHIGENVCQTINPTTGAPESNAAEFDRGIANFTEAITIGKAAGSAGTAIVNAAYAGLATMKAWKGDWAAADTLAAKVPASFVYEAALMSDGESNTLAYETHTRFEYTVWSTEFQSHPGDTRAPWHIQYAANGKVAVGANGSTPMYQQDKYKATGDNIPLTKGTEMLMLRAEAALRRPTPDIVAAYGFINQARAVASMSPLPVATTIADAWKDLHFERFAVTFLEGRHLWDVKRWFGEQGPSHYDLPKSEGDPNASLANRATCIPISENELKSNPNIPKP